MTFPSLTLKSPAKINLTLDIKGLRNDGFHNIDSLITLLSLHDEIIFTPGKRGVEFTFLYDSGQWDHSLSTVHQALILFNEYFKMTKDIKIKVIKRIPPKSGLGGGSSNGATVLRGLNILHNNPLSIDNLHKLAMQIGSDVPLFVRKGGWMRITGRGEIIEELPLDLSLFLVIVLTRINISTKQAYSFWDEKVNEYTSYTENFLSSLTINDLGNSFFPIVEKRFPEIQSLKGILLNEGAPAIGLSGSGGTLFVPFSNIIEANSFYKKIYPLMGKKGVKTLFETVPNYL